MFHLGQCIYIGGKNTDVEGEHILVASEIEYDDNVTITLTFACNIPDRNYCVYVHVKNIIICNLCFIAK